VPTRAPLPGVRVPVIRRLAAEFAAAHPDLEAADAASLLDALTRRRCREELLFGTFLLARYGRRLPPQMWARLDRWVAAIENWETCDQLAMTVAAPLVAREPALIRELVRRATSAHPWERRFAAATAAALCQKGRGRADLALKVCEKLMRETDPRVQKAVGWVLREAGEVDAVGVRRFLSRWKGRAVPRILREGGNAP